MKKIFLSAITSITLVASLAQGAETKKPQDPLKNDGVSITHTDIYDETKTFNIKRIHNPICNDKDKVNGIDPNMIWSGDYAKPSVPNECKKTFVTTVGKISPIKMPGIETYGELEVIEFIKKSQTDKSLLLVDARLNPWYLKGTIPTSVNLSFKAFDPKGQDFEIVMDVAGIGEKNGVYDFSKAKTLLLFCNGPWCPQSTWAIENLLKIGYPKEKLLWYRGGMYDWTMLNLTTVVPN